MDRGYSEMMNKKWEIEKSFESWGFWLSQKTSLTFHAPIVCFCGFHATFSEQVFIMK